MRKRSGAVSAQRKQAERADGGKKVGAVKLRRGREMAGANICGAPAEIVRGKFPWGPSPLGDPCLNSQYASSKAEMQRNGSSRCQNHRHLLVPNTMAAPYISRNTGLQIYFPSIIETLMSKRSDLRDPSLFVWAAKRRSQMFKSGQLLANKRATKREAAAANGGYWRCLA